MKTLLSTHEKTVYLCQVNNVIYKITVFNNEFVGIGFFKTNRIEGEFYNKKPSELTEEEKGVVICQA